MTAFAYAMGSAGSGDGSSAASDLSFIVMMVIVFAIFYFLLIRPQHQKHKEHKNMLANLTHGDTVMTYGGIHGKITAITDTIVTLEIAEKVRVKVARSHISAVIQKAGKE